MPITPLSDDGRSWPYLWRSGAGATELDKNWLIDRFMAGPAGKGYNQRPGFLSPGCMECTGTLYRYVNTDTVTNRTIENNKQPMGGPYYFHSGEWSLSSGKLVCPSGTGILFFPFSWKEVWQESVVFHVQEHPPLTLPVPTYADYETAVDREPERVFYFDFIDFENHHKVVEKFITLPFNHGPSGILTTTARQFGRRIKFYKVTDGVEELLHENYSTGGVSSTNDSLSNVALQIRYIEKNRWMVIHSRGLSRPSTSVNQWYYFGTQGTNNISTNSASFITTLHGGMWAGYGFQNPVTTPPPTTGLVGYHIFQGRVRKDSTGKMVPQKPYWDNTLGGRKERGWSLMVGNIGGTTGGVTRTMTQAQLRARYPLFINENYQCSPYVTQKEAGLDLGYEVDRWLENTSANEMQIEFDGLASFAPHTATQDYSPFGLGVHSYTKTYCTDCETLNGVTLIARRHGMQDDYNANAGSSGSQNPYFFLRAEYTFSLFHGIDTMLPCQGYTATYSANNGGFGPPTMFFTGTRTYWWSAICINPYDFTDQDTKYINGGTWQYGKAVMDIMTMIFIPQTLITTPDQGYCGTPNDPMANWTTHWFYKDIERTLESDLPDPHYPADVFWQKWLDVSLAAPTANVTVPDVINLRAIGPIDTDTLSQWTPYTNPSPIVGGTWSPSNSNHLLNRERAPCDLSVARIILTPIYDFDEEEPESLPWVESELPDVEPLPQPTEESDEP